VSVVKDVEMDENVLKEAFAKTEEPLGWYFAGWLSSGRERFDCFKKSAEGGCSWGQVAYGWCFKRGEFVQQDIKVCWEWIGKAALQNNPWAMNLLGQWFREGGGNDKEKAVSYYRAAAELGWKTSMYWLSTMLYDGDGCVKDLRQVVIWSAKGGTHLFWHLLADACRALGSGATEDLDCDFNQLCYTLGWGLYWYQYERGRWNEQSDERKDFGNRCLDYYCCCVELQQKSIFTFLLFWNRTTGVKEPGQMIAQMVWKGREDTLVKRF
jgi:TPR repeat protein